MLKAYKYRIYPTADQEELINKTLGCCRYVYNTSIYLRKWLWESKRTISAYDLMHQLAEAKGDFPWLAEPDSQALNAAILNMDKAYQQFFKHSKGFPKYKKRSGHHSFQCPCNIREVNFDKSTLTIPKMKDIPIVLSRRFEGKIKTITISRTPTGKYFASILVDNHQELPPKPKIDPNRTIGIDLGLKDFLITSDGDKVTNPKYLREKMDRLKILQYRASHHRKGSGKRRKANLRVAIQHESITNQRNDFLHKLSTQLVCENQATTLVVESLRIPNMVKNHHLSQSISDAGWGEFIRQLEYKSYWYGKNLIRIGTFQPSSKTCSSCGYKMEDMNLSIREWKCPGCKAFHDRDFNAAKNIRQMGLTGEGISEVPVELRSRDWAVKRESMLVPTRI
ncbi:MAG TPA: RNA-guided endonuclease TnpB family protein [Chitinophagaceae bacterium]|nr:RNA-guided endonuclease TnpB family protein [Chitinophagaceae bacterium]